ncbi:hypothetical protein [Pontivivens insulae]|uniref:Major facilitator superfamily (MFS) profile domain-containing protein n=1 Tax=Pontivivens insulae TaxID=1639689 RepID=A0A2R8ACI6_9RHOB|nr:hypothetical protein [Pontivivens insulae]RED13899.1 hypothetical protein DFR53_1245 [Pontivivens insulae]SPF29973.1 hypothetical protein POI8812_02300 [Pontivivens insulae]
MKGIALIANILAPGVGSMLIGRIGQGLGQITIWGLGLLITLGTLGIGIVIGAPMMIGAWIWAIVTAAGGPDQTINVHVNGSDGGAK